MSCGIWKNRFVPCEIQTADYESEDCNEVHGNDLNDEESEDVEGFYYGSKDDLRSELGMDNIIDIHSSVEDDTEEMEEHIHIASTNDFLNINWNIIEVDINKVFSNAFGDCEVAFNFYNCYARIKGFSARKHNIY